MRLIINMAGVTNVERFWELFNQTTSVVEDKIKYPDSLFGFNNDKFWWEIDLKNQRIWIRNTDFWEIFYDEFDCNYDEIQSLIKTQLEEGFKSGSLTPVAKAITSDFMLEEGFKSGSLTPMSIP